MSAKTGIKMYVVPIMLLVSVLIAFMFGLPLLSGMSGISSNMSVALDSVGIEVASGFAFIVIIIVIGASVQLRPSK